MADRPQLQAPAGACDCHMHFYDAAERYPVAPTAAFLPPPATLADYRKVQARLGLERVVVVQPTAYGTDNRCTMDAVTEIGEAARAVVVVDQAADDARARGADPRWRPRHPLPHVQGRRAALGHPRGNGGAGACLRLARPAAVQRPRAARARDAAAQPAGHAGDRPHRPLPGSGARPTIRPSGACSAWSRPAGVWIKLSAPYESSRSGPPRLRGRQRARPCAGQGRARAHALGEQLAASRPDRSRRARRGRARSTCCSTGRRTTPPATAS